MKGYSLIAEPLTTLTNKYMRILKWDSKCHRSFESLRKALVRVPMHIVPNWGKEFQVHDDDSSFLLSDTITQDDEEGRTRVISYASRKLNSSENNYNANDREMFWLIYALQRFRYYLEGIIFTVFVDTQVPIHLSS